MTAIPLAGRDAVILDLLRRVVAIGEHRGHLWGSADVWRVADQFLPHPRPLLKALRAERKRAEELQAENERLREHIADLEARIRELEPFRPNPRVVELTPRVAQVLTEVSRHRRHAEIAADLGIGRSRVSNCMNQAARKIGATSPRQAITLVQSGAVEVRVKQPRRTARTTRRAA